MPRRRRVGLVGFSTEDDKERGGGGRRGKDRVSEMVFLDRDGSPRGPTARTDNGGRRPGPSPPWEDSGSVCWRAAKVADESARVKLGWKGERPRTDVVGTDLERGQLRQGRRRTQSTREGIIHRVVADEVLGVVVDDDRHGLRETGRRWSAA